jgi:hypothetical protein
MWQGTVACIENKSWFGRHRRARRDLAQLLSPQPPAERQRESSLLPGRERVFFIARKRERVFFMRQRESLLKREREYSQVKKTLSGNDMRETERDSSLWESLIDNRPAERVFFIDHQLVLIDHQLVFIDHQLFATAPCRECLFNIGTVSHFCEVVAESGYTTTQECRAEWPTGEITTCGDFGMFIS